MKTTFKNIHCGRTDSTYFIYRCVSACPQIHVLPVRNEDIINQHIAKSHVRYVRTCPHLCPDMIKTRVLSLNINVL